jgi:cell division protein FtsI (penicillin-binding protein 3)
VAARPTAPTAPTARRAPPAAPRPLRRRRVRLGRPSRRLHVALAAALTVLVVLAGRLVQLQGLDAPAYAAQAAKQRLRTVAMPAPRGEILDRNGNRLAGTVPARALFADPMLVVDPPATAARITALLGGDPAAMEEKLRRPGRFVYLGRGLEADQVDRVLSLGLPGIGSLSETKRVHPGADLAANVIGFTGQDGNGLGGLEATFDGVLAGKSGRETMEVDPAGRQIPSGEHSGTPPVPGSSLQLTLDRDIQWQAQQALVAQVQATGSRSGSVIVMDPHTGEVLGLAGAPTFDPDQQGAAPEAARGDPAVSEVYEPGSVNKVITAAAALEAGVVTPDTPVTVPPTLAVYDRVFHDAEEHGVEHLTFTGVLAKSSNIGTVLVAQQLGKTKLYDALRGFGFGQSSGAGLAGESAGILPPPDKWSGTQAATIAFGQGVSVNALQMASVYATVANDGVRVPPRVVRDTIGSDGRLSPTPAPGRTTVVSPKTAQELRTMLEAVTSDEGTAPEARIDGFRVAGKTGTSQRVDPTCGCYRGYTASFVGMAPADNPQLVVAVVLQDPQNGHFGGTLAAPVFHDVMAFALQARQIPPTGTAAPTAKLTTD